ncbi:MAG: helix-turn-helix domain-containing protein, partial [bacterium]
MAYSIKTKEEAISLRKKGYSIREIADFLGIALSTSSTWLHNIQLNKRAENRLKKRRIFGQHNARKTALIKRGKMLATLNQSTIKEINNIRVTQQLSKLLCSFLFWTEGSKDNSLVSFSNSDPKMIKTFMYLLRKSFKINETKFRVLIHIHEYHDNQK